MKENKTSKEYLDNKACELADEQIEGVAGGVRPHNPCLECKHYKSLRSFISPLNADEASRLKDILASSVASADEASRLTEILTGSLTSADEARFKELTRFKGLLSNKRFKERL